MSLSLSVLFTFIVEHVYVSCQQWKGPTDSWTNTNMNKYPYKANPSIHQHLSSADWWSSNPFQEESLKCIVQPYQAGPSTAGSRRFVCQPTDPLAQAAGQMEALQGNEQRKMLKNLYSTRGDTLIFDCKFHIWVLKFPHRQLSLYFFYSFCKNHC